ncbi:MAG TPA: cation:proton antiporter [Prolixibacteraceae bacterium]|nr:cation:proton antiporter [Prolixibacteraceae bacterium]
MNKVLENLQHIFQTPFQSSVLVFAVILFIILLAPLIFRRIKVPGIIGLILAGIIIGPYGLNMIAKNSAIDLFSTIGLLYIMFLAGLELDMKGFASYKHKSIVFGFFTFIIPFAIGYPVCRYLLDLSFGTSFLVSSMFATNTLVTYPIVSRLGISRNEAVGVSVGGTMLTDTAVLIILAIISGAVSGELSLNFWIRFSISVLIFLSIVFWLIPKLATWFFRNFEGERNSHFIFVLAMVFFAAFLSELAGLEPIIGAFAAGIALNKLVPHTSSLMNRLEFVGNSLFIPFFLISVGMLIDVSVLFEGLHAIFIAATLTVVAIIGKYAAAWITAAIYHFPKAYRNLLFGLSSAHAASTIAVIMVGYRIGIVDENILNGTIILILVTCLVASFVTEQSAKQVLIMDKLIAPQLPTLRDQKILIPIYNPNNMERLLDLAMAIKNPRNHFPIVSLSVVADDQAAQQKLLEAKKTLEKAIIHAAAVDQEVEIITTISQNVPSGIKRVATEIFATEIILGFALKHHFTDLLFGNIIKYIVDNTNQAVWVCSISPHLHQRKKIVVICPRYADREYGFHLWLSRVFRLADSLKVSCDFLSSPQTFRHVNDYIQLNNIKVHTKHIEFTDWNEFLEISAFIKLTDLVIIALPRNGGVSYKLNQEGIPRLMAKNFENHDFILIYPNENEENPELMFTNDFEKSLIEEGLNQLSKKARSWTDVFRRK